MNNTQLDQLEIQGLDTEGTSALDTEVARVLDDAPRSEYRERFVAFIDLLGFRQIVIRTSDHYVQGAQDQFKQITRDAVHGALSSIPHDDYSSYFRPRFLGSEFDKPDLKLGVAGFSDTMIFWCDPSPEAFGLLIYAIFRTVREFTLRGFYCRGGIKKGELLVDETGVQDGSRATPVIFGPAFIAAYDLEQKQAGDARVILCNQTGKYLQTIFDQIDAPGLRQFFREHLFQAKDGPWQIDIFADFRHPSVEEKDALLTQAQTIAQKLQTVLAEYTESPSVFRKLLALAHALSSSLTSGASVVPEFADIVVDVPSGR